MNVRQPRYSKEEHARRGSEIYDRVVRPQLDEESDLGKIVAIDIETATFEIADDLLAASEKLLEHQPDAQTWFVRVGHKGVHRFDPHSMHPCRLRLHRMRVEN